LTFVDPVFFAIFAVDYFINVLNILLVDTNALAVANFVVDLALKARIELKQYGLRKCVYITYEFGLAMLGKSALNPNFDTVEAWKHGPVIPPSVYRSFKCYENNPITKRTTSGKNMSISFL
jgi:uncharacterized phage-associated protein